MRNVTQKNTVKFFRKFRMLLCVIILQPFVLQAFAVESDAPLLTRSEAMKLLKQNGYRWKQAETFAAEAASLRDEAHAGVMPRAMLVGRDQGSQVNLRQYGINVDSLSNGNQWVTFAGIGAEFEYGLYDQKSEKRLLAAESNLKAGEATSLQYQTDLSFYTLLAYLNAQKFARKVEIQKDLQKHNLEILGMAQSKLNTGAGIPIDVMRAKGLVSLGQLKELDAQSNYNRARNELANLLQRENGNFAVEPLAFEATSQELLDEKDITGIVTNRYDILAAKQTSEAASHMIDEAKGERLPKISIVGDAGMGGDQTFTSATTFPFGSIGVQITMPLYTGGYLTGKIQEASVKFQRAQLQAKQLELEAKSGILNSREQLVTAQRAVELSGTQVDISTEELKLAKKRFLNGAVGGFETSSAQMSYATALEANIDAIFAHEAAKLNYMKQLGKLLSMF